MLLRTLTTHPTHRQDGSFSPAVIIVGLAMVAFGFLIYYLVPLALLGGRLALLVNIFFFLLIAMLLGLVLLSLNFQVGWTAATLRLLIGMAVRAFLPGRVFYLYFFYKVFFPLPVHGRACLDALLSSHVIIICFVCFALLGVPVRMPSFLPTPSSFALSVFTPPPLSPPPAPFSVCVCPRRRWPRASFS